MSNSNKSDTPNIVVIMSDEHGGMFSSVAGAPIDSDAEHGSPSLGGHHFRQRVL